MPIRVIQDGLHDVPVILCDHCGLTIERATDALYHWRGDLPSDFAGAPVYYTHKKCGAAFEDCNPGDWGAVDLDCLPIFLGNNLGMNWKLARRKADVCSGFRPHA